jgi:ComEC/Rec2-related protein
MRQPPEPLRGSILLTTTCITIGLCSLAPQVSFSVPLWTIVLFGTLLTQLWAYAVHATVRASTLGICCGLAATSWCLTQLPTFNATQEGERQIVITARVHDVTETFRGTRLLLGEINEEVTDGTTRPIDTQLFARERSQVSLAQRGDTVRLSGQLRVLPSSYANALRSQGIGGELEVRELTRQGAAHSLTWRERLLRERDATVNTLRRLLPEPSASLLSGLLLGQDAQLPAAVVQEFRTTSLGHLTAISGANIALVLSLVGLAFWWLPRWLHALGCMFAIALFTLLVGAPASAVRAALTGSISLLALSGGRPSTSRQLLLLTLTAMSVWNPLALWYDVGFQLSFLAVVGLVELQPHLQRYLPTHWPLSLRQALSATLAAEALTLPWSMLQFGQLPLVAPIANLIVAPLVPIATLSGLALLTIDVVMPSLLPLAQLSAWLSLQSILGLAHLAATHATSIVLLTATALTAWTLKQLTTRRRRRHAYLSDSDKPPRQPAIDLAA